jgi:ATP-dependent RNA helicase RhlE
VLKADIEMRVIEAYAPTRAIRMGNDGPGAGRPTGQRPPRRSQPHAHAAPRHAQPHAGRGGKPQPQRDRRAINTPRPPKG